MNAVDESNARIEVRVLEGLIRKFGDTWEFHTIPAPQAVQLVPPYRIVDADTVEELADTVIPIITRGY